MKNSKKKNLPKGFFHGIHHAAKEFSKRQINTDAKAQKYIPKHQVTPTGYFQFIPRDRDSK